jgi:hypothetical protein
MKRIAIAAVLGILTASSSWAVDPDLEKFTKALKKVAPLGTPQPPGRLCACEEAGPLFGRAGYLGSATDPLDPPNPSMRILVECFVPTFDYNTGAVTAWDNCYDFEAL